MFVLYSHSLFTLKNVHYTYYFEKYFVLRTWYEVYIRANDKKGYTLPPQKKR